MMVVFVWTNGDEQAFENSVPLIWHGEYIRNKGWANPISVVFLSGFDKLEQDYKTKLLSLNYRLLDCAKEVDEIAEKIPGMEKIGQTPKFWFLRWIILKNIMKREGLSSIIHLDGDIVLTADPKEIEKDVAGKTFVLQGCPAFTAISDMTWFSVYERELAELFKDREGYIDKAMAIKNNPVRQDREYCNISVFRKEWFQDQDLLEYLIAAGKLPQEKTEAVFHSSFYWIQNPLFPEEWLFEQIGQNKSVVVEKEGVHFINNKQISFFHFQSNFGEAAGYWLILNRLGLDFLGIFLKMDKISLKYPIAGQIIILFIKLMGKLFVRKYGKTFFNRRNIYSEMYVINRRTGNLLLTDFINVLM